MAAEVVWKWANGKLITFHHYNFLFAWFVPCVCVCGAREIEFSFGICEMCIDGASTSSVSNGETVHIFVSSSINEYVQMCVYIFFFKSHRSNNSNFLFFFCILFTVQFTNMFLTTKPPGKQIKLFLCRRILKSTWFYFLTHVKLKLE